MLLGFYINNKLENLKRNLDNINQKVINLINKWKPYKLSIYQRVMLTKSLLISQYTYILTILDIAGEAEIDQIQLRINKFIAYNTYENQIIFYIATPIKEVLTGSN